MPGDWSPVAEASMRCVASGSRQCRLPEFIPVAEQKTGMIISIGEMGFAYSDRTDQDFWYEPLEQPR